MTLAEEKLWQEFLRYFKFRVYRQKPIHNYIVDFYCPKLKLVIEVDGNHHYVEDCKCYDELREQVFFGMGLIELRFTNEEVLENFHVVCREIEGYEVGKST
jgi:very-short-patch-repair endonuclease